MSLLEFLLSDANGLTLTVTLVLASLILVFIINRDSPQVAQLKLAKHLVSKMIKQNSCNPIMIRLAWHDSGTFDKNLQGEWPAQNGAIGTIRFDKELTAGPNAGLSKAINYLKPIKEQCDLVSWADLIQMASAMAIELAGGPVIDMQYGRVDADATPDGSEAPFGLPDALPKFGGPEECAEDPAAHLRWVFGNYGMGNKEIVALSGAHTLGRAFKERSGTVDNGITNGAKFTSKACPLGYSGMKGGKSWTKNWMTFDNSYFKMEGNDDEELIAFPTDQVLATDAGFEPYFALYRENQTAFFDDYAAAHKKLSELGSKFVPEDGIRI